jgi:hypothetical protein
MKRFVAVVGAVVGMMVALGWSGSAFAQATTITTACPTSFTCAFSAAETMSLVTTGPGKPGQPDVFVGYISFDASSNVTMTGLQDINGTVSQIGTTSGGISSSSGTCLAGANGQPAIITFADKSELAFVTDSSGNELQFILNKDKSGTGNSVRVGVCRKQ